MFSRSIAEILSKAVGEFIDLESSTYSENTVFSALLRGHLILDNIFLKSKAIDNLQVPLELSFGLIGHLEVKFPIYSLFAEPIIVLVDGLYLILEPKFDMNSAERRLREERRRSSKLSTLSVLRNDPNKKNFFGDLRNQLSKLMLENVLRRIFKNIILQVKMIHIRYEDHLSSDLPFCFGFTLENFTLEPHQPAGRDNNYADVGSYSREPGPASEKSEPEIMMNDVCLSLSFSSISSYWDSILPGPIPATFMLSNAISYTFLPTEVFPPSTSSSMPTEPESKAIRHARENITNLMAKTLPICIPGYEDQHFPHHFLISPIRSIDIILSGNLSVTNIQVF